MTLSSSSTFRAGIDARRIHALILKRQARFDNGRVKFYYESDKSFFTDLISGIQAVSAVMYRQDPFHRPSHRHDSLITLPMLDIVRLLHTMFKFFYHYDIDIPQDKVCAIRADLYCLSKLVVKDILYFFFKIPDSDKEFLEQVYSELGDLDPENLYLADAKVSAEIYPAVFTHNAYTNLSLNEIIDRLYSCIAFLQEHIAPFVTAKSSFLVFFEEVARGDMRLNPYREGNPFVPSSSLRPLYTPAQSTLLDKNDCLQTIVSLLSS